jgi:hypothetical protein
LGQRLTCPECHRTFTRALGTNRRYCFECHPARETVVELPRRQEPDPEHSLTAASRRTLVEAGVEDTWQAEAVLALARLVDENRHGPSGAAANVRAHRDAMSFALQDSGEEADVITMIFSEG